MEETGQAWDRLWTGVHLASLECGTAPYGATRDAAIAVSGDRIAWLGTMQELRSRSGTARDIVEADGLWLTPGLIDCHTHLVYGGDRAREFEMRLEGARYEDIARAGGGILSTVRATRVANEKELLLSALRRARNFLREGVTTLEIKSGYGLDLKNEMKMLRVARQLESQLGIHIFTTFLGAHALPPEYAEDRAGYIREVTETMLPAVAEAGLADAVDAFCEGIGFSLEETRRVFDAARNSGLPVKLHAEQLSDLGGAGLAAAYTALSADHLEYASEESVRAMALAGTVAVLLPGAFYFLRESRRPPVELLRRHQVPMAVASDSNPGSSPMLSLLLAMNMACVLFRLTPEEALRGTTVNAARALGLQNDRGTLAVGKRADFALWEIGSPAELCYSIAGNPCVGVVKNGRPLKHAI